MNCKYTEPLIHDALVRATSGTADLTASTKSRSKAFTMNFPPTQWCDEASLGARPQKGGASAETPPAFFSSFTNHDLRRTVKFPERDFIRSNFSKHQHPTLSYKFLQSSKFHERNPCRP